MGPEVIFYTFILLMALVLLRVHIGIALGYSQRRRGLVGLRGH